MVSISRLATLAVGALFLSSQAIAEQVTPDDRVKSRVVIRQSATTASPKISELKIGQSVELISEQSDWYEIRLQDGTTGFVSKAWTNTTEIGVPEAATVPSPSFKVHVIDIGTGLSVFIEGSDFSMLYDGGSQDDLAKGPDNRIIAYLKAIKPNLQTIDHLVLSHPHKDHVELLPDVFDKFIIKNVWDSGTVNLTVGYCNFLKKVAAENGVKYHDAISSGGTHTVACKGGNVNIHEAEQMTANQISLGKNASMNVLYRDASQHPDPNENSVVIRLNLGTKRILLAGDAEGGQRRLPSSPPDTGSIEESLLNCCASDLRADALIVGHHGSMSSSRSSFINAVDAKVYAISSGPHTYGKNHVVLPDAEIVAELEAHGKVLRTDIDDEKCMSSTSKIGPDEDESPGGCNNILIMISGDGTLTAGFSPAHD